MLLIPRATGKAYNEQAKHTYMFFVPRTASKQMIAEAVASEFDVTVTDVRVLVRKGKPVRYSRGKHAYPGTTNRQDRKMAYVTLKEGDKIPVFEEDEPANDEKATKKADKKADKKVEKKADKKSTKKEEK